MRRHGALSRCAMTFTSRKRNVTGAPGHGQATRTDVRALLVVYRNQPGRFHFAARWRYRLAQTSHVTGVSVRLRAAPLCFRAPRCLSLCSSGTPPARDLARKASWLIIPPAGRVSRRRRPPGANPRWTQANPSMKPRISMSTLGVANVARAAGFYEKGPGFPGRESPPEVAFFTLNGSWLGLYGREALAAFAIH